MAPVQDLPRGRRVYIPTGEVERLVTSLISEFGENAEHQARTRIAWAKARGLNYSARVWEYVLEYIEQRRVEVLGESSA